MPRFLMVAGLVLVMAVACNSGSRWTEEEAIAVAQNKLFEAQAYCPRDRNGDYSSPCFQNLANNLMKGNTTVPRSLLPSFAKVLVKDAQWSAINEPAHLRWRVTAGSLPLYVYERTGLVEGANLTPGAGGKEADTTTAEQFIEDLLKEAEANR